MSILDDLRRTRATGNVSLSQLSKRTGTTRGNLSTLLNGLKDPRLSSVERVAAGLGATVLAVPLGGRETVAALSGWITDSVREGDTSGAYRAWIQIADDLAGAEPFTRLLLAAQEPATIDSRWDAAIAGLVQWRLEQAGLPFPTWVSERKGDPSDRWRPPAEFTSTRIPDPPDVPDPLRDRGIWIEEAELESV